MIGLVALAAALATALLLAPLRRYLKRRGVVDQPNARSSHRGFVPRGAGIVVVPVIVAAWVALAAPPPLVATGLVGLALAGLGWLDDLKDLPVLPRLAAQILAVIGGTALLPADELVFQGLLPPGWDRLGAALLWLWFVNLFNFMDGIDGLSATAAIGAGLGIALCGWIAGPGAPLAGPALALAGAALGFLYWNRPRARIFLGDVGSLGLGFLLGALLLRLAGQGLWAPALILPLYHLADATLTLLRRLARRERVWQPARAHFYQRAADGFGAHGPVLVRFAGLQGVLLALAALAAGPPLRAIAALGLAGLIVAGQLWYFARVPRKGSDAH